VGKGEWRGECDTETPATAFQSLRDERREMTPADAVPRAKR